MPWYSIIAGMQGLASSEQVRRVTDYRWEMVELKDHQQDAISSCLRWMGQVWINSIYPLEKMIQWHLGSSSFSFFLTWVMDDMVILDCTLNGCCNLPVPFYVQVLSAAKLASQCVLLTMPAMGQNKPGDLGPLLSSRALTSISLPSSSFLTTTINSPFPLSFSKSHPY